MTPCRVKWCSCLAVDGLACAVHSKFPSLRPRPFEKETGWIPCEACDATGVCPDCLGEGEIDADLDGDAVDERCISCLGGGDCPECKNKLGFVLVETPYGEKEA